MFALGHASVTYIECGNYAKAMAVVDEVGTLAQEKGAVYWKARGMLYQGSLLAVTGKAADAVQMINAGITAWRTTG